MPTNPIVDAVSCLSRGVDCRHAAPPFDFAGPPARQADDRLPLELITKDPPESPQRPLGGKGELHVIPRFRAVSINQCAACGSGSRLLG
jgi:hypothetical protein